MSKYTKEFKLEVVSHYVSGLDGYRATTRSSFSTAHTPRFEQIQIDGFLLHEACRRFNIAAASSILVWQRQYAESGLAVLERKPRERPPMKPFKPPTKLLPTAARFCVEPEAAVGS